MKWDLFNYDPVTHACYYFSSHIENLMQSQCNLESFVMSQALDRRALQEGIRTCQHCACNSESTGLTQPYESWLYRVLVRTIMQLQQS